MLSIRRVDGDSTKRGCLKAVYPIGGAMTKAKRYDTVVLLEPIGAFQKGDQGAVVEVYIMPYEAYDIEIVTDEGQTLGLVEGVRPEQIEVPARVVLPPSASKQTEPVLQCVFPMGPR
jgi:outer membrane lipoprotein SlyB